MRIAIVGSRDFARLDAVVNYVNNLPVSTVIISGGAIGVDRTAETAARDRGMEVKTYLPDWDSYGKSAGFIRNQLIVDDCDVVVAFWNGKSRGTADTLKRAQKACKIQVIYREESNVR
jgi:hypothetical protein